MTKPKPCPFCGGGEITTELDPSQGLKWGWAACGACGSHGPEVRTYYDEGPEAPWRDEALEEWNRRPEEDTSLED